MLHPYDRDLKRFSRFPHQKSHVLPSIIFVNLFSLFSWKNVMKKLSSLKMLWFDLCSKNYWNYFDWNTVLRNILYTNISLFKYISLTLLRWLKFDVYTKYLDITIKWSRGSNNNLTLSWHTFLNLPQLKAREVL